MKPSSLLATALLVTVGGCASGLRSVPTAGLNGSADNPVRPGDRVALQIWSEPAMSDTFTVSQNGEIALPKLGLSQVANLPGVVLEDSLRRAYSGYLREPGIGVTVLRRVAVLGQVRQPGVVFADLTMSVPDVIARAGGLLDDADAGRVVVERGGEHLAITDAGEGALPAGLRSGDQIVVYPKSFWARNPAVVVSMITSVVGVVSTILVLANQ